jgi:hypothetical protein
MACLRKLKLIGDFVMLKGLNLTALITAAAGTLLGMFLAKKFNIG